MAISELTVIPDLSVSFPFPYPSISIKMHHKDQFKGCRKEEEKRTETGDRE